ncbi:hypothetical protein CLPU_4c01360 [Gottschalkia purinilytica]|uniref:Uncharacterized protein n=1 Tax=Gottschalkia purinilytica TaxID=1503 RepID=A0A0L0WCF6_GOTPU|nr:hypothetical protein CLPU_4c01360 [Gottschalkia purinilytica]
MKKIGHVLYLLIGEIIIASHIKYLIIANDIIIIKGGIIVACKNDKDYD